MKLNAELKLGLEVKRITNY